MLNELIFQVSAQYGEEYVGQELNILHLYLAITSFSIGCCESLEEKVSEFIDNYLIYYSTYTSYS